MGTTTVELTDMGMLSSRRIAGNRTVRKPR